MISVDYPIIDGDGHVVEPDKEMAQYLPERFRRMPGNREYSLFPQDAWAFGVVDPHKQDVPDAAMWLSFLDEAGISATVLYPSNAAAVGMVRRVEWSVDLARAYNDWLHDKFLRQSERLLGVALLPVHDVEACVSELRRCVGELGFVGAILPSISSPLMAYGNPEFDPIYATANELDTMIAVHGGFVGAHNFATPTPGPRTIPMSHATSIPQGGPGPQARHPAHEPCHQHDLPGRVRPLPQPAGSLSGGRLRLGSLPDGRPRRTVRAQGGRRSQAQAQRVPDGPQRLLLLRDRGKDPAVLHPAPRRREARVAVGLPARAEAGGVLRRSAWSFFAREDVSADSKRKILSENPKRLYRI